MIKIDGMLPNLLAQKNVDFNSSARPWQMTKVHVLVFRSSLTNHHLWCLSLVDDRQVLAFSTFSNHHLSWVPLRFLFDPCKSVEVKKLLSQSRSYDLHLELERTNNLWCSKGLNFHQSPRCIMYIHQGLVCRIYPKHCHHFPIYPIFRRIHLVHTKWRPPSSKLDSESHEL